MSDEDGGFLHRWARRKEEARRAGQAPEAPPADAPAEAAPQPDPLEADCPPPDLPPPDLPPTDLPPIESLDAASDYTAFLKSGVPKLLRRAALRKAWASDPAITGHKPLVDYDWDFNAPGYGKLAPGDDVKKLVAALFRDRSTDPPRAEAEASPPPAAPPGAETAAEAGEPPASPAPPAPEECRTPTDEPAPGAAGDEPAPDAAEPEAPVTAPREQSEPGAKRRRGGAVPR